MTEDIKVILIFILWYVFNTIGMFFIFKKHNKNSLLSFIPIYRIIIFGECCDNKKQGILVSILLLSNIIVFSLLLYLIYNFYQTYLGQILQITEDVTEEEFYLLIQNANYIAQNMWSIKILINSIIFFILLVWFFIEKIRLQYRFSKYHSGKRYELVLWFFLPLVMYLLYGFRKSNKLYI